MWVELKYRNLEEEEKGSSLYTISLHFLTSLFFWTTIKADIHPVIVQEIITLSLTNCFFLPILRAPIVLSINVQQEVSLTITDPFPVPDHEDCPAGLVLLHYSFSPIS